MSSGKDGPWHVHPLAFLLAAGPDRRVDCFALYVFVTALTFVHRHDQSFLHFLMDGFLWKMRRPEVQAGVGCPMPAAGDEAC